MASGVDRAQSPELPAQSASMLFLFKHSNIKTTHFSGFYTDNAMHDVNNSSLLYTQITSCQMLNHCKVTYAWF